VSPSTICFSSLSPLTSVIPHAQLLSTHKFFEPQAQPRFFRSDLMLVPEGLCLDFKNGKLFRSVFISFSPISTTNSSVIPSSTSSEPRRRLPNRHGNEKIAINRTDSIPPVFDWPQVAPLSENTQIIGLGVEPAYAHDYGLKSQMFFPSSLRGAPRASIILPSEQLSRPERKDNAGPPLSTSEIGRTVWSNPVCRPHSLRAMSGTETLVTQSSIIIAMPHETSSGSILESRRTEVMTGEWHFCFFFDLYEVPLSFAVPQSCILDI